MYYRAVVIKNTAWYWYRDRQEDQWNRNEAPEMNPHKYGHLIFDKGAKTIQWKKDSIFNKWFKWIKNLHIKLDTQKVREKTVKKSFEHMGTGEKFLNRTPMAYALRLRIDKWGLIKCQSFCKTKDMVKRTKRQPTDSKKIFTNATPNRGLILQYIQRTQDVRHQRTK